LKKLDKIVFKYLPGLLKINIFINNNFEIIKCIYYPQKYLSKLANSFAREVIIGTFSDFHIVISLWPLFPNFIADPTYKKKYN